MFANQSKAVRHTRKLCISFMDVQKPHTQPAKFMTCRIRGEIRGAKRPTTPCISRPNCAATLTLSAPISVSTPISYLRSRTFSNVMTTSTTMSSVNANFDRLLSVPGWIRDSPLFYIKKIINMLSRSKRFGLEFLQQ